MILLSLFPCVRRCRASEESRALHRKTRCLPWPVTRSPPTRGPRHAAPRRPGARAGARRPGNGPVGTCSEPFESLCPGLSRRVHPPSPPLVLPTTPFPSAAAAAAAPAPFSARSFFLLPRFTFSTPRSPTMRPPFSLQLPLSTPRSRCSAESGFSSRRNIHHASSNRSGEEGRGEWEDGDGEECRRKRNGSDDGGRREEE